MSAKGYFTRVDRSEGVSGETSELTPSWVALVAANESKRLNASD